MELSEEEKMPTLEKFIGDFNSFQSDEDSSYSSVGSRVEIQSCPAYFFRHNIVQFVYMFRICMSCYLYKVPSRMTNSDHVIVLSLKIVGLLVNIDYFISIQR